MKRILLNIIIVVIIIVGVGLLGFFGIDKNLILSITFLGASISSFAIYFIYKKFLDGIRNGVFFSKAVSQGDLSKRMYMSSTDEIGALSDALNKMVVSLTFMIRQTQSAIIELSNLVDENYLMSENITKSEKVQSEKFNLISASIKSLDNSIRKVSENIEQVSEFTEKAYSKTDIGKESVQRMVQEMDSLKGSSEQLNEITNIMRNISEKIHLLSLNSAIKLKKVASSDETDSLTSEIRKIAERTTDSTTAIEKIINQNKDISSSALAAVQDVTHAFNQIREDVEEISYLTKEIKLSTTEEQRESQHLVYLRSQVNEITESNIEKISEFLDFTKRLSQEVENLKELIAKFKTNEE